MKKTRILFWSLFVFMLVLFSSGACGKEFVKVFFPDGTAITAELAVTDEERQRGLMYRGKINADQGMLFIFEEESIQSFWMKNMKFSIDIIWLDREKRIIHIERSVPPCSEEPCPTYSSRIPAMYILEIKAGSADKNGEITITTTAIGTANISGTLIERINPKKQSPSSLLTTK